MNVVPVLGILSVFVFCPVTVFGFIYLMTRRKTDVKKLELQKEIAELENEKMENKIKVLELESKNLDRLIEEKEGS